MFYKFLHHKNYNFSIPRDKSTWPKAWGEITVKQYPRFDRIILPEPTTESEPLTTVLSKRHSSQKPAATLDIQKISNIMHYSAGIRDRITDQLSIKEINHTKRHYPSAGQRYPLEIYVLANNVVGLKRNIYHFNVLEHSLEEIAHTTMLDQAIKSFRYETHPYPWAQNAQAIIAISAMQHRSSIKYQDEGYITSQIECGHLAQNILLTAANQDIAASPLYGFNRHELAHVLDFDSDELMLYSVILP